jgi:SAM-dependent methyltransferase
MSAMLGQNHLQAPDNTNYPFMLRKIYYALPPSLRLFFRKIYYFPLDFFNKKRNALEPPKGLIYTGRGDFIKQGEEWVVIFKQYTTLNENSNVLDIGSGIGRIAVPMTRFLKGNYRGFDAVKQGVDWCNEHISAKYPNFQFDYVDLFNDLYKSKGISASNYPFPYPKGYFDFACAISVFTHMLPDEVENYLREAHKTLKEGGYFVATFFILDDESRVLMSHNNTFNFKYDYKNYALMDEAVKSANVAFDKTYLFNMVQQMGFKIVSHLEGYWCGREKEKCTSFQDIIVMTK